MKLLLIAICFSLAAHPVIGQRVIDVGAADGTGATDKFVTSAVNGQMYDGIKFVRVTGGSPFFKDQFMQGKLFDDAGGRYVCSAVRINLLDNEINFLAPDGKEMTATSPVRRIVLTDTVTKENYYFILGLELNPPDKILEKTWLQVLVNDETSLCLQKRKMIHETPAYGTATTDQDIVTIDTYFLRLNGSLVRVKNWQDLQTLLGDRKDALDHCIHDHHLKGRTADDYIQLVQCYNAGKRS
jgi:hypothetical protein